MTDFSTGILPTARKIIILRLCGYKPRAIRRRAVWPDLIALNLINFILKCHGQELQSSGRYVLNEALPKGQVFTKGRRHPIEWISQKGLSELVNPVGAAHEQPLLLKFYEDNDAYR